MMTKLRDQVKEFHETMGQPVLDRPQVPDRERVTLRLRLIAEEFCELLESAGVPDGVPRDHRNEHLRGLIEELLEDSRANLDLPAFTDALADLDYVVEGTRLEFGIDGEPVADAVHRANMAKLGGGVDSRGKYQKPPGWRPPDVAAELLKQGWCVRDGE